MADRPIMEVFVELEREKIVELDGPAGRVVMLPFGGTVRGELFSGVVCPGGVDTQVTDAAGVRSLSARYMLSGTDSAGRPCRIYVDNEGRFAAGELPSPFVTTPTFLTDSEALAPYLHRNRFRGEGHPGERGPVIRFFEVAD